MEMFPRSPEQQARRAVISALAQRPADELRDILQSLKSEMMAQGMDVSHMRDSGDLSLSLLQELARWIVSLRLQLVASEAVDEV